MRDKRTIAKELINQILILFSLGLAVLWLILNRSALGNLGGLSFLRYLVWILPILYGWILLESIRAFSANYLFKRYDPADPASLAELRKVKRYRAFSPKQYPLEGDTVLIKLIAGLKGQGFQEVTRQPFGLVLEKGRGKAAERVALIYKPMLNVLISSRHLKEASDFILKAPRRVPRNALILLTDMDSDSEILSSAVSVVNHSTKLQPGLIFVPYVLDLKHGRLFYPQDNSGQSLSDRQYFKDQQKLIIDASLAKPAQARPGAGKPPRQMRP